MHVKVCLLAVSVTLRLCMFIAHTFMYLYIPDESTVANQSFVAVDLFMAVFDIYLGQNFLKTMSRNLEGNKLLR